MTKLSTIIELQTMAGAHASLSLHGGHLLSWQPMPDMQEQLYLSDLAHLDGSSAIRGGVPVLFPQFGSLGDSIWHGFARKSLWQHASTEEHEDGRVTCCLRLCSSDATRAIWPYEFELGLSVILSDTAIELRYTVTNNDTNSFEFSGGLHTYFATNDISQTEIIGLGDCMYIEAEQNYRQIQDRLTFNNPIDRIYQPSRDPHTDGEIMLSLNKPKGRIAITSIGFTDVVVWNPWQAGAAQISDMLNQDYKKMICVEAVLASKKIMINAGSVWQGSQRLVCE